MTARFNLPDINFIEVDPEEHENLVVSKFEELQKVTLNEADPRRKFFQSIIFLTTMIANNIDFTGKQNLLAYAVDNYLDHQGVKKNVPRLGPVYADTIFRFEVEAPETFTIKKGIRFSVDDVFFYTDEEKIVNPGKTSVDIHGICEVYGMEGNGYLPGQITNLVDPDEVPWVSKAYNITKTEGGADWEDDDAYAERIRQSNAQYSTAGPEDAYHYHAMSAHSSIVNISVTSPSEGVILIVPLLKDGVIPDNEIIQLVYDKVSAKKVRPLTDHVIVQKPEEVFYEINVTYYVSSEKSNVLPSIQAAINQAIEDYQIWQKSKLGRGIDPSELIARIQEAGGKRITVTLPSTFTSLKKNQVAKARKVTCAFGGILDD